MSTTIVTRTGKGGRLSVAEMDANFTNLQATADAAAPQSSTYTKTAVDTALAAKAPLASPGFTGTVTGITAAMVGLGSVTNDKQLKDSQTLAHTGDVTSPATALNTGTVALTLATITDSGTGSFKKVTVNTKGLVTGTASVAQADITGLLGAGSITNTMLANTAVANLSGTNTGDETTATIKTKLSITTLSGSNTGDQTITLTGDATGTGTGSFAVTLASSGVTAGTYNNAATTHTPFTVDSKGRVTGTSAAVTITPAFSSITSKPTTLTGYGITDAVASSSLGVASGVATLGSDGKLTTAQVPAALVGALQYQGIWDASTNTPTLVSSTGTKGQYYKVSVAGTTAIDGISTWKAGDLIVFNGTTWDGVDSLGSEVTSVFGRIGSVVLTQADVTGVLGAASITNTMLANAAVANLSGTNTGDETAATIKTKLGIVTLSGSNTGDQTITLTGDATGTGTGSFAVTLAASGVTAGTVNNSATAVTPITVDAKGRVTGTGTAVTITPAFSSLTGKPTTLSGYGITDAAPLASPTFTGTVAGITAAMVGLGNVTNVAQLAATQTLAHTGDVTAAATALSTGTIALTLAASGVTAGTYNNAATTVTPITVDAKGRVTATGTAVTITPAFSSITGLPTTLSGYGITDAGYLNIPQVSNSANYTTVLTDSGKHLLHPSADTTARTFTIAANASVAYPIGTTIAFVNQNAAGALTIAIATDTMRLAGAGTTGSRTLAANGIATAVKITATEWIISGTNLT